MNCTFTVDELLSAALRTLDRIPPGTQFIVRELIPFAIWKGLPLHQIRDPLGHRFSKEMESHPDVRSIGKTDDGQTIYLRKH